MSPLKYTNSKNTPKPSFPFQRDTRGRYVFYPHGRFGKGYVVQDPGKRKRISRLYTAYTWTTILAVIWMRLGRYSHQAITALWGFGALLVMLVAYPLAVRAMVKGLPVSGMEYKPPDGSRKAFSRAGLWVLAFVLTGAGILFLSMAFMGRDPEPVAGLFIFALILLAIAGLLFWRLWLKRNEKPPAAPPRTMAANPSRALWAATSKDGKPKPVYWTWGLIGFLALVFTLENIFAFDAASKAAWAPGLGSLVALGGSSHNLIFVRGDWWRFFTPVLLHASLIHILFNGFALLIAGLVLERLVGPAWFLALFFLCGFGGSLFSVMLNPPSQVGVGASGAIMGLIAAGFLISFRLPDGRARQGLQYNLLQMLILNVAPFFLTRGIGSTDYGAHLGGALVGGTAGYFLFREWDAKKFQDRWGGLGRRLAYGGGAVYLAAAVFAAAGFNGSRQWYADNHKGETTQLYTAFIQKDPKNAKAFYGRGYLYYQEKTLEGYQKAIQDFTSAIALSNNYYEALFYRGCAYRHLGEFPLSVADMDQCAQLKADDIFVYNNRGLAYAEWKKYGQALKDYAQALRINPKAAYILINEGDVYLAAKKYDKAMADLNQAIALDKSYGEAFVDRGSIYLYQGNLPMALADFNTALQGVNNAAAYRGRAQVYEKMGQHLLAESELKKAKYYERPGLYD
jgi:membrane associated rhomboid family serine protease/Tfp pilus assembly protein PilF